MITDVSSSPQNHVYQNEKCYPFAQRTYKYTSTLLTWEEMGHLILLWPIHFFILSRKIDEINDTLYWTSVAVVQFLSCVWLFVTPWTVAYQAPPSIGFSGQEYWSGLPFPSPFFLVHCIWRYNLSIRLIIGDVNFDHLVKVVYARCFSVKLAFFPFVIMFSNSWWDTWRLCKSPVPHQTSIVWC